MHSQVVGMQKLWMLGIAQTTTSNLVKLSLPNIYT